MSVLDGHAASRIVSVVTVSCSQSIFMMYWYDVKYRKKSIILSIAGKVDLPFAVLSCTLPYVSLSSWNAFSHSCCHYPFLQRVWITPTSLSLARALSLPSPRAHIHVVKMLWFIQPTELAYTYLFCSRVCFCSYGPFNYISFHKFSRQLSTFSHCFTGVISALLVRSTIHLFMKVSLRTHMILVVDWA